MFLLFNKSSNLKLNLFGSGKDEFDYEFNYDKALPESFNHDNEYLRTTDIDTDGYSINDTGKWYIYKFDESRFGWKLHISPKPQYCIRIHNIVKKYCMDHDIAYKRMSTLTAYMRYERYGKHNSQYGKFICIYPKTDNESRQVADDLHKLFNQQGYDETCFIPINYDFEVYSGIYTRLVGLYQSDYDSLAREQIGINISEFCHYLNERRIQKNNRQKGIENNYDDINDDKLDILTYIHPFNQIKAFGVIMPKLVIDINIVLYYCYIKYLIMAYSCGLKYSKNNVKLYMRENDINMYEILKMFGKLYHINDHNIDIDLNIYGFSNIAINGYYDQIHIIDLSKFYIKDENIKLNHDINYYRRIDIMPSGDPMDDSCVECETIEKFSRRRKGKEKENKNIYVYPWPLTLTDLTGMQDWARVVEYDYYKIKNYIENEWNPKFEDEK